jgi:hypothetical protein
MLRLTIALATSGFLVGSSVTASPAPYAPKVGQRHSDFTLPMIGDRAPVSLSDFRGKKVLLIHFSSW